MINLAALERDALRVHADHAAATRIADKEARWGAYAAIDPVLTFNGVCVRAIYPECRTALRRPHVRFEYRLRGNRVSKAAAAAALGGPAALPTNSRGQG